MNYKLSLLAVLAAQAAQAQEQRPNIVYIMTDDHTAQMMSCYDNRFVETPNLDRIAQDGVRFTRSYVANSLSGPSRACMLTGKHSHKNGFTNNEHGIFDGSQQTMPKLLQAAGYTTALIGKWHLVSTPTGFDHWEIVPGQGDYYNPSFITMDQKEHIEKGYITRIVTDKAISWMNAQPKNKPFALFLHHKACHRCWLPALEDLNLYEDKTFALPETFYDNYEGREAAGKTEMEIGKDMDLVYDIKMYQPGCPNTRLTSNYLNMIGRMTKEERTRYDAVYGPMSKKFYEEYAKNPAVLTPEFKYQRYMRDYAKVVHELDVQVGRVLDYLKAQGLLDNTLVVYTSDQGFYMGEHGWFDKRFIYEESLSTPLVMRLPQGYQRRGVVNDMVQNIDYAPTFLEMAGVSVPADIQGMSLVPLLKGKKSPKKWRDAIYYHYHEYPAEHTVRRHYGMRTDRYKLVHYYGHDINTWELFDLKTDPQELHNIYGKPGNEKLQQKLHRQLEDLQIQYDDTQR